VSAFDLHELITGTSRFYSVLRIEPLGRSLLAGGPDSSRHDDCSGGPANTRQHISSIFLLSRQSPRFSVHLDFAAQNSRCACAAEALAAAIRYLDAVLLRQIEQGAPSGNLTNLLRVKEYDGVNRASFLWMELRGPFAFPETLLQDPFLLDAESGQNLACVVHKSLGTTDKESRRIHINQVL
jgi:hypothetical protein